MKKKDRKILKGIFSELSNYTYSELKSRFEKEYEEKLKIDTKYSNDLNIEGRLEREEYITNLDSHQLESFKFVVKSIQEGYLFTEDDIDRLNNFTSRINYLLKSTSPHNRGMADQMNNIKHGAKINPNAPTFTLKLDFNDSANQASKNKELQIHKFFNNCVKSKSWSEFKSNSGLHSAFFDKSFEWKLVYVFSNIKNCQEKTNYPLYYAAWQVIAEWCFDVEYGNYDAFCEYYRNIDFLDDPKLLHFSCYYYLLRLALRNDIRYKDLLESKQEKEKQNIIKELREDEDDDLNIKEENNNNISEMATDNKFYILAINQLSRIFSNVRAGKEFEFAISTSESVISDSAISIGDVLLAYVDDKIYYQFNITDKTNDEIRLKKVFEIEKSIGYSIDEEGVIKEITKEEFDSITSKLFNQFVSETALSDELQNETKIYIEEKYTGRFVFQVLKYLDELDELDKIKPFFRKNTDVNYTSIKADDVSLSSIFKTSENVLSKDELTFNDGKPRFFEDILFFWNNENYYLSTEWTSGKDSRLDLDNFKILIEKYYPKYSIYEQNGKYFFSDKILESTKIIQIDFDIKNFQNACKNAGLVYSDKLITRFASSLMTKPFVILTGLSGSGKTKLAQAFVQWICQEDSQYCMIPVGADWTNREPLLGYPNALKPEEYVKPDSGVIDLIIQANSNPELPHFLILDEMNLSHVERYFADFLSVMESKEEVPLYAEGTVENGVPSKLKVPENLFIIGTVNIDETTNMFSPKVLDRANTIEFRINNDEMAGFLGSAKNLNMSAFLSEGANMAQDFIKLSGNKSFTTTDIDDINKALINFFGELQKSGAEFGYRSATEILRLINQLDVLDNKLTTPEKIDIAIMQKLLPKLHGSRRKLAPILETLGNFCVNGDIKVIKDVFEKVDFNYTNNNVLYPLSLEKIARMYKGAIDNGFTSFAEA
ncbi:McrB family protein [Hyunsoonleella aestuarii]|uniref:DUF3578 domain-containing protein n=1 Tax=Hyunsoonleella aestuarii TaxID=912802 RepID=A0ABP8EDV7_9FLAO|nr:hypothetical protein [Hyunsoonleella aestuarii]